MILSILIRLGWMAAMLIPGKRDMKLDYQSLLANISDGVYFTDPNRTIIYWNKAAEEITGYSAEEVVGHGCHDNILIHVDAKGRSLCQSQCPMAHTIKDLKPRQGHVFLHHKLGHRIPVHIRTTPLVDEKGEVVGGAEFFTEESARQSMHQRIKELQLLALLDPLTELPNRHHLEIEIDARFHEMQRMGLSFGLLFMDIDHFKNFNDAYGHQTGDEVLQTVARTLRAATRPFDLVGRWGGEEFLGVIRNVHPDALFEIGERLRELVGSSTVTHHRQRLQATISIGATMARAEDSRDGLINRADELMYASKQNGRNRLTVG
jgi:diguanylate cyclase (GGDEF)-like protein/PAS domain S-box-containing protein